MLHDPLNNYPEVYRAIGNARIVKTPQIPDANLCIGDAEYQSPAPIAFAYKGQDIKAVVKPIETQDDLAAINAGKPVNISDFPVDYWLGGPML